MGTYINKGNSAFSDIVSGEYVDKSGLIAEINDTLNTEYRFSCVTRCRRFGKSMAAKMLCAYYDKSCDSRELFKGLHLQNKIKNTMKELSLFIAFAMLAALTMVSCNNKPKEPTQEDVQEMKQVLADSVLAEIDALADECNAASENGFRFGNFEMTEKEKKVKPDYLLDPSEVNRFVTKSQKVNALAIYAVELGVRELYEMPTEEVKETIAKLAAEVNYPYDHDQREANAPISERLKSEYEKCKENDDLALFWQFSFAIGVETNYILAQNPSLFFSKITEEQWKNCCQRKAARRNAIKELAQYDEEMATLLEFHNKNRVVKSDEERDVKNSSIESAKQYMIANKDKYIAKRNAMLQ